MNFNLKNTVKFKIFQNMDQMILDNNWDKNYLIVLVLKIKMKRTF